ncbi:MAG: SCP2 sterol-binding domain-containing protein [Streptosporangiaceae bacterium]
MATAEECRTALDSLTGRIAEMDAKDRAAHLLDRTLSCRVPDLGIIFLTRLSPNGAEPVRLAENGTPVAQVRFTANSDVVIAISANPGGFMRAWLTGRLKVQGSVFDLLHLRKMM